MGYKVGDQTNLHSENYVREHDNRERSSVGAIDLPTIGHKGQEGSDPDYPDSSDHIAIVTNVEELNSVGETRVSRECSCGLTWIFNHEIQHKNIFEKET